MNFFRCVVVASVSVVAVSLGSPALAEALEDSEGLSYFNEYVQKSDALLNQWESAWKVAVGLAVFVVILGAVSAVLQGFQSRGVKITTAICGLLVTIITGLTNTVGWDHRELNRSKSRGQTYFPHFASAISANIVEASRTDSVSGVWYSQ